MKIESIGYEMGSKVVTNEDLIQKVLDESKEIYPFYDNSAGFNPFFCLSK